jgi:hypothetical protein
MGSDFIYTVSRFGVSAETETLLEHAELVREAGTLVVRIDGLPDRKLSTEDIPTAFAEERILSEIPANQITRIKAVGVALDLLPFLLTAPGDPDDFDERLWSKALANEHTSEEWVVQPGRCRVAYINDARWCPWPTEDGPRMLPENWPTLALSPMWARITFSELASMTSGVDEFTLGLVTPGVAAACSNPDSGTLKAKLWQRTGTSADDARILVEWLLDWIPKIYFVATEDAKAFLTQLFVSVACNGRGGQSVSGSELVAGWGISLGVGDTDTSEWTLELSAPGVAYSRALDLISERSDRLAAIVTAGREPDSVESKARTKALEELQQNQSARDDRWGDDDEEDEEDRYGYDYEDDPDDQYDPDAAGNDPRGPWSHSPLSRMPSEITPGEIPIQFWREYGRHGRPVGLDFVFTWDGRQSAKWSYGLTPDQGELPTAIRRRYPSFHGTATWADWVNVELTYSSSESRGEGKVTLEATAPTLMAPRSTERLKRPGIWVDFASRIILFLIYELRS